jgi:superfamily I DNA/RNA helicase
MTSIEQRRAHAVEQQQRVVHGMAPMYVQACPGAGKTRVIVERHLSRPVTGARRGRALVSFTNVACAEIVQRCADSRRDDLLRFPHFVGTIDTFLWRYLVRPFIEPDRLRHRIDTWDRINAVVTVKGQTYDHKIRLSDFQFHHDLDTGECTAQVRQTNRVYPVLNQLKKEGLIEQAETEAVRLRTEYAREHGYVTGHEVRVLARHYLRTRCEDVIALLRTRFDEIVIDEAQDCSNLDLAILEALRGAIPMVFIGDPDQAIYEFRGADPDNVRAFGTTLAEQIELTGNWRSTPAICQLAATLRPSRFTRPADDPIGDYHNDTTSILLIPANTPDEIDAAVTVFTAHARDLGIPTSQQLVLAHAGRRLPKGSASSAQPPTSPTAARVAWAAAVLSDAHPQRLRDTAYDILERALITYWYNDTDGVAIDVLCDRHGLNRPEFRRQAARVGVALPTVDQGTFAEWCKTANTVLKKFPPTPGQSRLGQSGNLLPGTAKDKRPRTVIKVPAGGSTDEIRASVIHQVKGEQADAVLVVLPDDDRTASLVNAWITGDHDPDIAESLRVLYVAATRARRLLTLALSKTALDGIQPYLTAKGVDSYGTVKHLQSRS